MSSAVLNTGAAIPADPMLATGRTADLVNDTISAETMPMTTPIH